MSELSRRINLSQEPDFTVGSIRVSPSACRVFAGAEESRVEAQTLTALIALARANGATVSRDELIEVCWDGRVVSDDAVTRTIAKVRALAKGITPPPFTLETLPKVGYRLIIHDAATASGVAEPATASELAPEVSAPPRATAPASPPRIRKPSSRWRLALVAAGLAIAVPVAWAMMPRPQVSGAAPMDLPSAAEVAEAAILLDKDRLMSYLDRGWDPNWKLDSEGDNALHTVFLTCERSPTHDKAKVAEIVRTLLLAGTLPNTRNKWNDSALDIAISPRYCGPLHPAVAYLKSMSSAEELHRVMTRACGEAFGRLPTKANWSNSGLTREACAVALARKPPPPPKPD